MAQCFFRCPSGAGDWLLVELQGELTSHSHSSFQNLKLGTLRISADGTPSMEVGNQLLEGKVEALKKPLLVCRRMAIDQAPDESNAPYEVAGVARKRVLFRNRPQPIVTAPLLLKQ